MNAASVGRAASFLLRTLLFVVVERLSPLWGRDESVWVFGARGGEAFVDNAKYLYLHVAAEHPEVRPVWLSKDPEVVAALGRRGYEAHHAFSLSGVALALRAGVVVITQGLRDVNLACAGGATIVNLWHGVPLKRIAWDAERAERSLPFRLASDYLDRRTDLLATTGEAAIDPFVSGLRVDPERVAVTGYPRNDVLVRDLPGMDVGTGTAPIDRMRRLAADGPVVMYLPTFRGSGSGSAGVTEQFDFAVLDAFLAEHDASLVIKTHPKERLDLEERALSRVVSLPAGVDVYPLLRHVDVLVTDYSSVMFDYLLLDEPVVLYAYDLDRYRTRRRFYYRYEAVAPGPVTREFDELLAALERVLETGGGTDGDAFAVRRRAVRERFFAHPPGGAAERVFRTIAAERRARSAGVDWLPPGLPDRDRVSSLFDDRIGLF